MHICCWPESLEKATNGYKLLFRKLENWSLIFQNCKLSPFELKLWQILIFDNCSLNYPFSGFFSSLSCNAINHTLYRLLISSKIMTICEETTNWFYMRISIVHDFVGCFHRKRDISTLIFIDVKTDF